MDMFRQDGLGIYRQKAFSGTTQSKAKTTQKSTTRLLKKIFSICQEINENGVYWCKFSYFPHTYEVDIYVSFIGDEHTKQFQVDVYVYNDYSDNQLAASTEELSQIAQKLSEFASEVK